MLEILLLIVFCKKIGSIVAEKGYSKFPFQLMLVALWFGGEIAGLVIGFVASGASLGRAGGPDLSVYVFGLGGAAVGAIIAFVIASNLRSQKADYDDFYRERSEDADWPGAGRREFGDPHPSSEEGYTDRPDAPPPYPDGRIQH
jgi:hypothetical protein